MEITLYEKDGRAAAYISSDGETLYLWNGYAVAYFEQDRIHGWNGQHLGWFQDGVIYDADGLRVGFTTAKCPAQNRVEPVKQVKHDRCAKYPRYVPSAKPVLGTGYSCIALAEFLKLGAVL